MADDLGHGDVDYNGHKIIKTPQIDKMGRGSMIGPSSLSEKLKVIKSKFLCTFPDT